MHFSKLVIAITNPNSSVHCCLAMQEHTRCHFEWERGRGKKEGIEGKNRVSCLEHSLLWESPDDFVFGSWDVPCTGY